MGEPGGMRLLLFVFAKNEESQFERTVRGLQAACSPDHVAGMVLFLAQNATGGCLRTAEVLNRADFPIAVEIARQPCGDIPACLKAVLDARADITHVLFVAADYFLEPAAIAGLIGRAARDPGAVHKFSRALPGGGFSPGYPAGAETLYRLFCAAVRVFYGCKITDPSFFIMAAPVRFFRRIRFKRTSMLFGQEWMYALLRAKAPVAEIPAVNLPRTEMGGTATLLYRLRYVTIAVAMRLRPMKRIWEKGAMP